MRKVGLFFFINSLLVVVLLLFWIQGDRELASQTSVVAAKQQLVARLGITDLALCSEARYTRHPSQADVFAAFQDLPGAYEHFPSGSVILPRPIGFVSRVQVLGPR